MLDYFYKRNHVKSAASSTSHSRVDVRTRLLVGAVIGSVVGLIFIVVAVLLWRRYCRVRNRSDASQNETGEIQVGRPSSAYSEQPLSDPFAAEVKTVVESSNEDVSQSPLASPVKQQFTIPSLPHPSPIDQRASESYDGGERDLRMSSDVHGMPELSETFVANVRATARSPPPL